MGKKSLEEVKKLTMEDESLSSEQIKELMHEVSNFLKKKTTSLSTCLDVIGNLLIAYCRYGNFSIDEFKSFLKGIEESYQMFLQQKRKE